MSQLALFEGVESPVDSTALPTPDEVDVTPEGYTIAIFRPHEGHLKAWLRRLDEAIRDMTGYSVHDFAVVPTFGGWQDWPKDHFEAARMVLVQDVWGQAFLGDLDLE